MPDLLDLILQASKARENEIAAQISDLRPLVDRQYALLLKLCRKATNDTDEATGIVHGVFLKFFQLIWKDMWLGNLRHLTTPEAWLTRAALNAIEDFRRERSRRKHGERPKKIRDTTVLPKVKFGYLYAHETPQIEDEEGVQRDVIELAGESMFVNTRRSPEESVFDREILMRYLNALRQLTALQRTVYILYKDDLLSPEERQQLLSLDARVARIINIAQRARPHLRVVDIANLLRRKEGTLSSVLTRAKDRLQVELADLRWKKRSELPAPKWQREFLVGFAVPQDSRSSFRVRLEDRGKLTRPPWLISARDKDYVRGMRGPSRTHENLRTPNETGQSGACARLMDLVPGWVQAPEPDDPQYMEMLERIRVLLKGKKRYATMAKVLNAEEVPPLFGKRWHHTAVRLIARRAGLVKATPTVRSVPLTVCTDTCGAEP
jgi:RNA polymerase sigma factor (sigma-70 family)